MNRIVAWLVISIIIQSNAYSIDLNIPNAHSYHKQQDEENEFKYGYRVENINSQFQHKQKGSDDVTYGCYGHVDPDGRKQLTFFVADRLGFRPVLIDQPTTVYPVTSATGEGSGVTGGKLMEWKNLPFPDACLSAEVSGSSSSSSSSQSDLPSRTRDYETDTAESRDAFQRTLLSGTGQANSANDVAPAAEAGQSSDHQPSSYDDTQTAGDHESLASWQLDANNNGIINSVVTTSGAADERPRPPVRNDEGHGGAIGQSSGTDSWQPFLGASNSFMLRSQCQPGEQQETPITLYIPFRVSCSDMHRFEEEVAKLAEKFQQSQC